MYVCILICVHSYISVHKNHIQSLTVKKQGCIHANIWCDILFPCDKDSKNFFNLKKKIIGAELQNDLHKEIQAIGLQYEFSEYEMKSLVKFCKGTMTDDAYANVHMW